MFCFGNILAESFCGHSQYGRPWPLRLPRKWRDVDVAKPLPAGRLTDMMYGLCLLAVVDAGLSDLRC